MDQPSRSPESETTRSSLHDVIARYAADPWAWSVESLAHAVRQALAGRSLQASDWKVLASVNHPVIHELLGHLPTWLPSHLGSRADLAKGVSVAILHRAQFGAVHPLSEFLRPIQKLLPHLNHAYKDMLCTALAGFAEACIRCPEEENTVSLLGLLVDQLAEWSEEGWMRRTDAHSLALRVLDRAAELGPEAAASIALRLRLGDFYEPGTDD